MHTKWRALVEIEENSDGSPISDKEITDAVEYMLDEFSEKEGMVAFDYYSIYDNTDEGYRFAVPATDPEFFVRLEDSMQDFKKHIKFYKERVKESYMDYIGKEGDGKDVLLDDFLNLIENPTNRGKSISLNHNLTRFIKFVENEYTPHSGMIWDISTYNNPYPDEDMIKYIKDNKSSWYIVDVGFHY